MGSDLEQRPTEEYRWWAEVNGRLAAGETLSRGTVREALDRMLGHLEDPSYLVPILGFCAAFTTRGNWKGYTDEEIAGLADGIESLKAFRYPLREDRSLVFVMGSGGDTLKTFNISTGAAMVAAAAGAVAPKVGGPTVTSQTGSARVAEALGFNLKAPQELLMQAIEAYRFAFFRLNEQYPWIEAIEAMRQLPFASAIFTFFSPLRIAVMAGLNPLDACRGVKGLPYPHLEMAGIVRVLAERGYERALMACGLGPTPEISIDELSVVGSTKVCELRGGRIWNYTLVPEDVGLRTHAPSEISPGGSHEENAHHLVGVISGRDRGGRRDAVLLNAAASLYVAGVAEDLRAGVELAARAIDRGQVVELMEAVILKTQGDVGRFRAYLR